nr:integrase, catalytic region, zinc finger, CCHC-type, peptidase aspartic, catalytic [Tanacetum cinerariifolium]
MLSYLDHEGQWKFEMQTFGSGISNLLAVATTFTGSGNLYCQWKLLTWQWECLVHFIPNKGLTLPHGNNTFDCTIGEKRMGLTYLTIDEGPLQMGMFTETLAECEEATFHLGGQDNVVYEDVDEQSIQDIALNVDNVFQADDCDAFDSDVDEAHTAQTMFMENLSSAYPVYNKADPSTFEHSI